MNILDLSALIGYFIIIFATGLYFGKKGGKDDYYLGGKNLHWNFLMLSIIATETSSLTFLGVPGMSYKGGIQFLQTALGFLFGRIIVAYVFLPLYLKSDISSVYEWIGVMFGKHVQRFSSTLFLFTRLLGDGIRLYATSIPCALLLGNWVQGYSETEVFTMSLAAITAGTMIYTVYGGFKSVVATDSIQFLVYIAGGLFAAGFLLHSLNMPFNDILSKAYSLGKLKLYNGFEGSFLTSPYFFLNGFAGGLILTICSHGIDQMFAQRLLACGSLREAKLALIGSGIFVFFQFMLFLFIGILLFLYYGETGIAQDKIFSKFILEQIPSPVKGLILAGILASAMSTLSSSINSMSLSIQVDLFKTSHSSLRFNMLSGLALFFSSLLPLFLHKSFSEGLVDAGLKAASFTYGPLLGLFLLARISKSHISYSQKNLNIALLLSLFSCIGFFLLFRPALGHLIPFSASVFFFIILIFPGTLTSDAVQKENRNK